MLILQYFLRFYVAGMAGGFILMLALFWVAENSEDRMQQAEADNALRTTGLTKAGFIAAGSLLWWALLIITFISVTQKRKE